MLYCDPLETMYSVYSHNTCCGLHALLYQPVSRTLHKLTLLYLFLNITVVSLFMYPIINQQ